MRNVSDKQLLDFMNECYLKAGKANFAQRLKANQLVEALKIKDVSPIIDKIQLSIGIEEVFKEHGEEVGSIVMIKHILPRVDPAFAKQIPVYALEKEA